MFRHINSMDTLRKNFVRMTKIFCPEEFGGGRI